MVLVPNKRQRLFRACALSRLDRRFQSGCLEAPENCSQIATMTSFGE